MWAIWAKYFLPQALKSCPKCNKLLNLVTLIRMECLGTKLDASGAFFHCFNRPNIEKIIKPQCPASSLTTCCFCIQVEQKSERCLFSSPNGVGKLKMMNKGIWKNINARSCQPAECTPDELQENKKKKKSFQILR